MQVGDVSLRREKWIRIVRVAADCPLCGDTVELMRGKPDHRPPLVGSCLESHYYHVFSFDRICVDMFGEGFDLPQLKIAALHDRHKSLAITLQFVGRFTRDYPENVGDAHVVANVADDTINNALRNLYAEDADWNFLLKMLSEATTGRAQKRNEMLEGFTGRLDDIPLQTLFPRMSAVIYRTACEQWDPLKVIDEVQGTRLHAGPVINHDSNVAIFITRDDEPVRWGEVKQIQNVEWNLHVLHWSDEQKLLFINSSSKDFHEKIAEAVCGETVRIAGKDIFRVLGGVNRLLLSNLGVSATPTWAGETSSPMATVPPGSWTPLRSRSSSSRTGTDSANAFLPLKANDCPLKDGESEPWR